MTLQELVDRLTAFVWALEEQTQRPEDAAVLSYLRDAVTAELEYHRRRRGLALRRAELEPADWAPARPGRSRLRVSSFAPVGQRPAASPTEGESPPPALPLKIRGDSPTLSDGDTEGESPPPAPPPKIRRDSLTLSDGHTEGESPPPAPRLKVHRGSLTLTDGAKAAAIGLFAGSILRVGLALSPAVAVAPLHAAAAGGFAAAAGPVVWGTVLGVVVVPLAAAATCWRVVEERRDFWLYVALGCTTLPLLSR